MVKEKLPQSFEWTFQEFEKHERSVWWYVIAALVVSLVVIYSFLTNNFLFTVIAIITVVILFARQMQEPGMVECEITSDWIRVGTKKYNLTDLASFAILERDDGLRVLYLHEARGFKNMLPVPIIDSNPESIRMFLRQLIDEDTDHQQEPMWDWLMRVLKL